MENDQILTELPLTSEQVKLILPIEEEEKEQENITAFVNKFNIAALFLLPRLLRINDSKNDEHLVNQSSEIQNFVQFLNLKLQKREIELVELAENEEELLLILDTNISEPLQELEIQPQPENQQISISEGDVIEFIFKAILAPSGGENEQSFNRLLLDLAESVFVDELIEGNDETDVEEMIVPIKDDEVNARLQQLKHLLLKHLLSSLKK